MDQYRLFIAIELDNPIQTLINEIITGLRSNIKTGVRWVAANSIHLTLKFIGDFPANRVDALKNSLDAAVANDSAFSVGFSKLGAFPSLTRPRVIWMGVDPNPQLMHLASSCDEVTSSFGVPVEDRPFSPHLTLGRVCDYLRQNEVGNIGKIISMRNPGLIGTQTVNDICLIRSVLSSSGPVYSILSKPVLKNA